MKKIISWIKEHIYVLMVFAGMLFIILSLKTQTILITDTKSEQYTIELQYSVFGYCVSAVPMTKEAQPIAADHMFLLGSIDNTVGKAASWIHEKTGDGVSVFINGYPQNKDKLFSRICDILQAQGIETAELSARS